MFHWALRIIARILLSIRYSVTVNGLKKIKKNGTRGILFLPNHPALVDPLIVMNRISKYYHPRPLADKDQVDRPVIRTLLKKFHPIIIPDLAKSGHSESDRILAALNDVIEGLRQGDNILMYPSGHLSRQAKEVLGGSSAVEQIVKALPDVRIVLARTRGLWGSSFSWADGNKPLIQRYFKRNLAAILLNAIFFMPRRKIRIDFIEPENFPRKAGRLTINQYLEEFYNQDLQPNTFVPYFWWQIFRKRVLPEPQEAAFTTNINHIPSHIKEQVITHVKEITGITSITPKAHLAKDLAMDSLTLVDLMGWIEQEFGHPQEDIEALQTVGDCILAASGEAIGKKTTELKPIPKKWFAHIKSKKLPCYDGNTITEVFLNQAKKNTGSFLLADQLRGAKTNRDIIMGILALKKEIEKIDGSHIGIMLPASTTATILILAVMFSGKVPVMVNWTVGEGNIGYSLEQVGVTHVLTARALLEKLKTQGFKKETIPTIWLPLEDIGRNITLPSKITALIKSYLSWKSLKKAPVAETAVVLFTSGSEAKPKAVPLTHTNILTNIKDIANIYPFATNDKLLGILPPFHSFGFTGNVVLPLTLGMPAAYHANPTEAVMLAKLIDAYKATLLIGTPTFVQGIVRVASSQQLQSLHYIVSGAEKCPEYVYNALYEICPQAIVCEGYGITECSPVVSANRFDDLHPGSIGHIFPSVTYTIVDPDTLKPVPTGEKGILLVEGPSIFSGYIGEGISSPFVTTEGKSWYNTGDFVSEDKDGIITFIGRLKRFIKLGGEMISLPAIETSLQKYYPSNEEGPTFAIEATPSEDHPEIVMFTTFETSREEANKYLRDEGFSGLHNIRQVITINEIPVLGTGKTDYRTLKESLSNNTST